MTRSATQFVGPVTLEARAALRQALRANGFAEDDIPAPLRAVASKRAQEERADDGAFVGAAIGHAAHPRPRPGRRRTAHPLGRQAVCVGTVTDARPGSVELLTAFGGRRG